MSVDLKIAASCRISVYASNMFLNILDLIIKPTNIAQETWKQLIELGIFKTS